MNKIPVINCISNIVTANDCANVLLAAGFSPIMADEPAEMAEIAQAADACVINLGTPSDRKYEASENAGAAYNGMNKPVVIDPVGVAASAYRREHAAKLLELIHPDVIRCNLNEALALIGIADGISSAHCSKDEQIALPHPAAGQRNDTDTAVNVSAAETDPDNTVSCEERAASGVDNKADMLPCGIDSRESAETMLEEAPAAAARLAKELNCTVLISGAVDTVSDGRRTRLISGGSDRLKEITGSGCMLSALLGGYCAEAVRDGKDADIFEAVCRASADYKHAAELAVSWLSEHGGTGELRMRLIDAVGRVRTGVWKN